MNENEIEARCELITKMLYCHQSPSSIYLLHWTFSFLFFLFI